MGDPRIEVHFGDTSVLVIQHCLWVNIYSITGTGYCPAQPMELAASIGVQASTFQDVSPLRPQEELIEWPIEDLGPLVLNPRQRFDCLRAKAILPISPLTFPKLSRDS